MRVSVRAKSAPQRTTSESFGVRGEEPVTAKEIASRRFVLPWALSPTSKFSPGARSTVVVGVVAEVHEPQGAEVRGQPDLHPSRPPPRPRLRSPACGRGGYFDLAVDRNLSRLDQNLRLAAGPDDVRGLQGLAEVDARGYLHRTCQGSQLRDGSRIGMIRYRKSVSSPSSSTEPPGTMSPGFRDSLSLKRTFSESTAETPSSR